MASVPQTVTTSLSTLQSDVQSLQTQVQSLQGKEPAFTMTTTTSFELASSTPGGYVYGTVIALNENGQPYTFASADEFAIEVAGVTYTTANGLTMSNQVAGAASNLYGLSFVSPTQLTSTNATIFFSPPNPPITLAN